MAMTPERAAQLEKATEMVIAFGSRVGRVWETKRLAERESRLESELAEVKAKRWKAEVTDYLTRVLEVCAATDDGGQYELEIFSRDTPDKGRVSLRVYRDDSRPYSYCVYRGRVVELALITPRKAAETLVEIVPDCGPRDIVEQFPVLYDEFLRTRLPDRANEFRQALGID